MRGIHPAPPFTPLQPVISTVGKYSTTDDKRVPLLVDFGERVLEMNPLRLFNTSGFGRCARRREGGQVLLAGKVFQGLMF